MKLPLALNHRSDLGPFHGPADFFRAASLGAVLVLGALGAAAAAPHTEACASLPTEDLVLEARAALALGFLCETEIPEATCAPSAIALADLVIARADASTSASLSAHRIKLIALDRMGNDARWQAAYAALPPQIPGVSGQSWSAQKRLWRAMHDAARFEWRQVENHLRSLEGATFPSGEARADFALVAGRAETRRNPDSPAGHLALAEALAHAADLNLSDPLFDPYWGQEDFGHLSTWAEAGPVLALLEQDASPQRIGLRRWFELASPSVLGPLGTLFPDTTAEDRAALQAAHDRISATFAPDPSEPVPAVGGYRELLLHQIRMEDLAYVGEPPLIAEAIGNLPTSIARLPQPLVDAYRAAWIALGHVSTLNLGGVAAALEDLEGAADLLPPSRQKGLILGLLGLASAAQGDPQGVMNFAEAFRCELPHEKLCDQYIRGLTSHPPDLDIPAVLAVLARPPLQERIVPQTRAARGAFGLKFASEGFEEDRADVLEEGLTDAVNALFLMEIRSEPVQAMWREKLRGPVLAAVGEIDGASAAAEAEAAFDGPVFLNRALRPYIERPVVGPHPPVFHARRNAFQKHVARYRARGGGPVAPPAAGAGAGAPTASTSGLEAEPWPELEKCLAAIPDLPLSRMDYLAAEELFAEAERRGVAASDCSVLRHDLYRLRRAEWRLGRAETAEAALDDLRAMCGDAAVGDDCKSRARAALDATTAMETMAGYLWAQDWWIFVEREFHHDPLRYMSLVAGNLRDFSTKPEFETWLADTSVPHLTRQHHVFNVATAFLQSGDDDRALRWFHRLIDGSDLLMPTDDVLRPMAELHRIAILARRVERGLPDEERIETLNLIAEIVRERLADPQPIYRSAFAQWGLSVAWRLRDDALLQEFQPHAKAFMPTLF